MMGIFQQLDWLTKKVKQLCCLVEAFIDNGPDSLPIQINNQSTSYILQLTDTGKFINITDSNLNTLTIPLNATVGFPIGTQIFVAEYGTGQVTIAGEPGVTLRSANGKLKLAAQYSGASLIKIDTDEWYVFGDLSL